MLSFVRGFASKLIGGTVRYGVLDNLNCLYFLRDIKSSEVFQEKLEKRCQPMWHVQMLTKLIETLYFSKVQKKIISHLRIIRGIELCYK